MFPPLILNHPVPVEPREVDGTAHVDLTAAEPDLLIRLSRALHADDPTGERDVQFRRLSSGAVHLLGPTQVRARALLTVPEIREALTLTFTPAAAGVLANDIEDAAATVLYGPDDEPLRGADR